MRIKRIIGGCCVVALFSVANLAAAGSDLADAAMTKNKASVRTLLSQKADVNATQADGATALHWAVKWDDAEMVDQLIKAGANVKAANRVGATPMYLACVNGNAAIIEKLLNAGADVNTPFLSSDETPLMTAARTGKPDAIKLLLDHGANANAKEKLRGTTALMWAAEQDHADAIKLLASRGADVSLTSTASRVTTARGNGDTPEDTDVGTRIGGLTALSFAVREGGIDSVKALLAAGANVNQPTADGTSPLELAVLNGNYDIANFLMDKGADPNQTNAKGWTPLYQAVKNRNLEVGAVPLMKTGVLTDELPLIKSILDHGADPNIRAKGNFQSRNGQGGTWLNENGATPFLRASLNGDITVMRMLLQAGSDPSIATVDHTTPLMVLSGVGFAEGFVFMHSDEETLAGAKLLLDLGADVLATNDRGLTSLHGAAHRGDDQMVQFLADRGAVLNLKDHTAAADGHDASGLTPLDWAIGVRISAASPIYKETTVQLLVKLMNEHGVPVPAGALGTIGGKRSAAGSGVPEAKTLTPEKK